MQEWVSQFRKGLVELCVLNLLDGKESYGYEMVRRLQDFDVLSVSENTLYPVLARLRKDGYLAVRVAPSEGGPARRYFSLTRPGREHLAQLDTYWEEMVSSMSELRNKSKNGEKGK